MLASKTWNVVNNFVTLHRLTTHTEILTRNAGKQGITPTTPALRVNS